MDGSQTIPALSLGDIFENAMRQKLPFRNIRRGVYEFLRMRGCTVIAVDRIGDDASMIVMITYWNETGETVSQAFEEWPSYTNAQPLSTW